MKSEKALKVYLSQFLGSFLELELNKKISKRRVHLRTLLGNEILFECKSNECLDLPYTV